MSTPSSDVFIVYEENASKRAAAGNILTTGVASLFVLVCALAVIIVGLIIAWDGFIIEARGATLRVPAHMGRDPVELIIGLAITVIGLLVLLGVLRYILIDAPKSAKRFARDGKNILGEIVECTGQASEDDYSIQVRYRFQTPDGKEIIQQVSSVRNDLKNKPIPAPGTSISIIYINDEEFKVL